MEAENMEKEVELEPEAKEEAKKNQQVGGEELSIDDVAPSTSAAAEARYMTHDEEETLDVIEIRGEVVGGGETPIKNDENSNEPRKDDELEEEVAGGVETQADERKETTTTTCVRRERPNEASVARLESAENINNIKPGCSDIHISMNPIIPNQPRRKRLKLDWFYILPIFYFCLPAFTLICGAITTAYLIPANHENFATIGSGYQITRMLALILDTVALALTIYVLAAHLVKFFSAADPKLLKYFTEMMTIAAMFLLLPFNILMIVAEESLPESFFNVKVNQYAYLTSGIFGLISIVPLLGLLFFSKIYEVLCVRFTPSTDTSSETTEI